MNYFDIYISVIFIIKIGFIIMSLNHLHLKFKGKENSEEDKKVIYWRNRFDFIFTFLMALLLIYLFNPRTRVVLIDSETKTLLYLFGVLLIIKADWGTFFKETKWFKFVQKIFK